MPIHVAVLTHNMKALEYLMETAGEAEHARLANLTQNEDFTPVLYAAHKGNFKILEYLLERGGDLSLKSKKGVTALHLACASG